jgi:hypothetical protein
MNMTFIRTYAVELKNNSINFQNCLKSNLNTTLIVLDFVYYKQK